MNTIQKYNVLEKYSLEFIEICNHNETASKVFGNHDILLIIFSFFKSGWGYTYHKLEIRERIFWEDILKKSQSRFELFINHGKQYINYFDKCKFEYSMTGFRVIKPNVEKTDERTTIITTQDKFIDIFSGKIDTCSWAANEVLNLLVKM